MIIARFGDTWASAQELSQLQADDRWVAERPAIVQQVGGAGGVFDHWGDDNFPISPLRVVKEYAVSAASYAAVETAVDTLRANSIALGRSKLWGQRRGGTTSAYRRWAWAKCVSGPGAYERRGGYYTHLPVELEFICPEGLWYAESQSTETRTNTTSFSITNSGNHLALVKATLSVSTQMLQRVTLANTTRSETVKWGGWYGSITGATNTSPIVITSNSHGLLTGERVHVQDVAGNTAANGDWVVTVIDANTFSLDGSQGNGAYTSGGTWYTAGAGAIATTTNATPIQVNCDEDHGLSTGDHLTISGTGGVCDGDYTITVVDDDSFTLDGTSAPGSTASAGQWQIAVNAGDDLEIDSGAYSCLNDDGDAYRYLARNYNQVGWILLSPGSNSFTLAITQTAGGSFSLLLKWYATYLL